MRIGALAKEFGLAPSAIRHYEKADMFSPGQVMRHANGYRDYTPAAVRRLRLIVAGRAAGFTLTYMRTQLRDWDIMSDSDKARLLREQLAVIDGRIAELRRSEETIQQALRGLEPSDTGKL